MYAQEKEREEEQVSGGGGERKEEGYGETCIENDKRH